MMSTEDPSLFEEDAFLSGGGQTLNDELLGKGYMNEVPLGCSSLAAELQSAMTTIPEDTNGVAEENLSISNSNNNNDVEYNDSATMPAILNNHHNLITAELPANTTPSKLASMAMEKRSLSNEIVTMTSPLLSPLQWSTSSTLGLRNNGGNHSRRSSFSSSTWSSSMNNDFSPDYNEDLIIDPFEVLKRQLEDLNTAVWETKTLHKRLLKTLTMDETAFGISTRKDAEHSNAFTPPFEYVVQSVINLIERKSRDRERQISYLRNVDSTLRKESSWMTMNTIRELEFLLSSVKSTLNDSNYVYQNPLPMIRDLTIETTSATDSLEELKELMYVNKRQVQELNARLKSIAKTVHEVRKDMRRMNQFLEEKDDEDDLVILEKGEVTERVREIMWGLDDLDTESTKKLEKMQHFWDTIKISNNTTATYLTHSV
ncbi:hypothetical protein BDF20DRAFT_865611 [Mycotypha africana]|uniref:uncharacterized protein n=1 Tax=Mycotypha africana TaxID=64632 RepID=UPI002301743D|nr:uncharacterized protein BDF20DRAFT_865611 [Mycotypha africana]KAI8982205.1 hypothetical protein BDF20DRAFT_865611 [Mycotypha africana]